MTKIKKSDLKTQLLQGIQILKSKLNYAEYCYFILAVFFFYHTGAVLPQNGTNFHTQRLVATSRAGASFTLQKKKRNLQGDLIDDFSEIEGTNPMLKDVLLPAIPATTISDSVLNNYLDQLDQFQKITSVFSNTESFGQTYDYWISQLAKLTLKQGVSFYTPRSVIRLMVGITKPGESMTIYDPTVGTGGMFTESANYIRQKGGDISSVTFYGCETAPDIWAICKMNLLAHGLENIFIQQQDALLNTHDLFGKFDLVLQNIPVPTESMSKREIYQFNEAFLKHAFNGIVDDGRGAILMPSSILQEDREDFWRQIISQDWLEAVIGLPAKLLHGTNSAASIIVINKQKLDAREGKVQFIRPINTPLPYTRHNELDDKDITAAIDAFESWRHIPEYASVVSNTTIAEQGYKLSVDKYLSIGNEAPNFDITSALKRYRLAAKEREVAVDRLMKSLEEHFNFQEPD
ncbi:MAG: N-6 DNA methylase [Chloroflexota bacterium]